jgi:hypothetical protein
MRYHKSPVFYPGCVGKQELITSKTKLFEIMINIIHGAEILYVKRDLKDKARNWKMKI